MQESPAFGRYDATPEHFGLAFRRQFDVGEHGDMIGVMLSIAVPVHDELRELNDSFFSEHRGGPIDLATHVAQTESWIAQVHASPAFRIPMSRNVPDRFSFGVDDIG